MRSHRKASAHVSACGLGLCFLLLTSVPAARAGFDVCGVLPRSTIESVQGEAVVDTKSSERVTGGLTIAQCYYALPTHTRSISLEVTLPGPEAASRTRPRDHWRTLFHGEREETSGKSGEPLEVEGVGQEAFWTGNAIVGALYVLEGDNFLRISLGGQAEHAVKVEKSKTLARAALGRLAKLSKGDKPTRKKRRNDPVEAK